MSIDQRRRSLLLLACLSPIGLSPIARASALLAPTPAEEPADTEVTVEMIRLVFEMLKTHKVRAAEMEREGTTFIFVPVARERYWVRSTIPSWQNCNPT
jgi:hypothetical protein